MIDFILMKKANKPKKIKDKSILALKNLERPWTKTSTII